MQTLLWIGFFAAVGAMLFVDLYAFQKKSHAVSMKEAGIWSLVWLFLAIAFAGGIWSLQGGERAMLFLTAYILEKSLSVDNLFIFVVIFHHFSIPPEHQSRVLHWGIIGAVIMRFIFIFAGVSLVHAAHWVLYIFGAILLFTAVKLFFAGEEKIDPEENPALRLLHKLMPVTKSLHGQHFFAKVNGVWHATPLFAAIVVVEFTDLVFALDSVPAALAVTSDLFLVYTSNIFAILGLRALYFLLAASMPKFRYLKPGIALVLAFVGVKLMIQGIYKIPVGWSLTVVGGIMALSIVASIVEDKLSRRHKILP